MENPTSYTSTQYSCGCVEITKNNGNDSKNGEIIEVYNPKPHPDCSGH